MSDDTPQPPIRPDAASTVIYPPPENIPRPGGPGRYVGLLFENRYRVEKLLGVGGIGEVFLARDTSSKDARVVLKVLSDTSVQREWLRKKFQQEIEALRRIRDDGVVRLLHSGTAPDGRLFLVMDYINGPQLAGILQPGGLPFERVADIIRQLGRALTAIHAADVRHRDLKPANIMLETSVAGEERVRIIDLGIATVLDADTGPTQAQPATMSAGTTPYMAPEQLLGRPRPESDIFALGVIAFEMLTGVRPFPSTHQAEQEKFVCEGVKALPCDLRRDLPDAAQSVLLRALRYDYKERYQRACDFGDALARALTPGTITVQEAAQPEPEISGRYGQEILTQSLQVTVGRDSGKSGRECLIYTPGPLGFEVPPRVARHVDPAAIADQIEELREEIVHLNRLAMRGAPRGEDRLGLLGEKFAARVLPPCGLSGLLRPGMHPMFDLFSIDVASEIPWEALVERGLCCPRESCGRRCPAGQNNCSECGERLAEKVSRPVMEMHLSHLVRGTARLAPQGRRFLFIEDPTGDLCSAEYDRGGICDNHLGVLHERIRQQGFEVDVLRGAAATVRSVLTALGDPGLAGVYYFGHGYFPRDQDEGCLLLHDRELPASRIEDVQCGARLVFLNACEGGASHRGEWQLENRPRSVATAFAQGRSDKVVIAPLWPIVNTQAAETALEFFRVAAEGRCFGKALQRARKFSEVQYEHNNAPHIAFMAYRYFGDPNRSFPAPASAPPKPSGNACDAASPVPIVAFSQDDIATEPDMSPESGPPPDSKPAAPVPSEIFDEEGNLQTSLFGFAISDVLLRAAKRRNFQHRRTITATDFLAGLLRLGNLTRRILRGEGADADEIYRGLGEREEAGAKAERERVTNLAPVDVGQLDEAHTRELLAQWVVRQRGEFEPPLIELLTAAEGRARSAGGRLISEEDVLFAAVASPVWVALDPSIPPPGRIRSLLDERARNARFDENGAISLDALLPDARAVIENAHLLSLRCGADSITHRALFAAFVAEEQGFGSRVCRAAGCDPRLMWSLMLSMMMEKRADIDPSARPLGLTEEACARIVIPVLDEAKLRASDSLAITEADLFRGFCERAAEPFKKLVMEEVKHEALQAMEADLGELKAIDPDCKDTLDGLTFRARRVMRTILALARSRNCSPIPNRLVLAGLLLAERSLTLRLFAARGWPGHALAERLVEMSAGTAQRMAGFTPEVCARIVTPMLRRARDFAGDGFVTERLLLRAYCAVADPAFKAELARGGMDIDAIIGDEPDSPGNEQPQAGSGPVPGDGVQEPQAGSAEPLPPSATARQRGNSGKSTLETFGIDLVERAKRGECSAVTLRDGDIEQAFQTLMLMENANPLLVGEAGVGKTAIVAGMAQRIADGTAPPPLRGLRLIELPAGRLFAGTSHRGELEERLERVMAEARGGVVLFVDEIHMIFGTAAGAGPDIADLLKTALARGGLRLIGATTHAEFKRTFARDHALARRFQVQHIRPPSREETVRVLAVHASAFEKHHKVRISKSALVAATDLSGRYLLGRQWPAKARDALERACVLATMRARGENVQPTVRPAHVASVIAQQAGLPVERVEIGGITKLSTLEGRLAKRIAGQSDAIHGVSQVIERGRQGLAGQDRPWATFLLIGPPGVGKTEMAKAIAAEVFGGDDGLIRFDMGDFVEAHSSARLIGAPPGYVGFDQGAPLVERIACSPYSLVLFDEIEHAHENVLAVLLRLLSEGTVADVEGNVADARNVIVVMTSNLLSDPAQHRAIGFGGSISAAHDPRGQLDRLLPAKLLDRIDLIVRFSLLDEAGLTEIARMRIGELAQRITVTHRGLLHAEPATAVWIAKHAATEGGGARSIARLVALHIADPIGDMLLHYSGSQPVRFHARIVDEKLELKLQSSSDA